MVIQAKELEYMSLSLHYMPHAITLFDLYNLILSKCSIQTSSFYPSDIGAVDSCIRGAHDAGDARGYAMKKCHVWHKSGVGAKVHSMQAGAAARIFFVPFFHSWIEHIFFSSFWHRYLVARFNCYGQ